MLMTTEAPVNLDVLDAQGGVLSTLTATLLHLCGEWATLAIKPEPAARCLRWGASARFWISEGSCGLEVIGQIVSHGLSQAGSSSPTLEEEAGEPIEALMRLWSCTPVPQRRQTPRRAGRFLVKYRPLPPAAAQSPAEPEAAEEWLRARCVDLGGGGIRLRTEQLHAPYERVQLQFCAPARPQDGAKDKKPPHTFDLSGRVLRSEVCGRHNDSLEMVVKFERLSTKDSLALAEFLASPL